MMDDKPWWWPQPVNDKWRAEIRADYDEAETMDDDEIDDHYADGWRYATTWDHVGDARAEHEELADAFLRLVEEAGKKPSDFLPPPLPSRR